MGGVENVCKYLVDNMKANNDVAVVCFNEKRQDIIDTVDGVKVYRVGTKLYISRQALSISYFKILKKAIREFHPDVIHFHWANPYPAAVLLALLPKNVKLVVHWHMDIIKQKRLYNFVKPIERKLLQRANIVLVTSPNYRDGSLPLQPLKKKVFIVPNAIEEDNLIKRDGDEERIEEIKGQYNYKDIIFFVGRHVLYKGLSYLIEAEKKVTSDCVFVIAGTGPLTEELKVKSLSKRIHFIGRISNKDLRCYMYASKLFAFPSVTKNEAFGVALAEAMYCNTPAATFTIPGSGVNWVSINNETCLEAPNRDVIAYANNIDKLLTDKLLYERLQEAGHKRVKNNFLKKNMIEACESAYSKLEVL